jgi:hypothetical protein
MATLKKKSPPHDVPTRRHTGGGYKLGPRKPHPLPADALWMNSNQLCDRYGGKSKMWLHRKLHGDGKKLKPDPDFPQPTFDGRLMMFSVAAFDEYDGMLLSKRVGS